MLQVSFDTAAILSLFVPGLLVLIVWKYFWSGLLCGVLAAFVSWTVLNAINIAEVDRVISEIDHRHEAGEQLSYEDQMYDGVGDRVAILAFGWIPAGISVVVGVGVSALLRRSLRPNRLQSGHS